MKKISIVIPIYNSEKYLNECINSVISQQYKNLEIILINDGSIDHSKKICENFCKMDNRVKLINQENSGVSNARNNALNLVTGDYVMFIDSDDYIEANTLEQLSSYVGKYDLICFGYSKVYRQKKIPIMYNREIDSLNEIKEGVYLKNYIKGIIANKIFNINIIKKYNIKFKNDIYYCEDLLFVTEYLKHIKSAIYINKNLYNYRMQRGSVSHNFLQQKSVSIFKAYNEILKKIEKNPKIEYSLKYDYLFNYYKLKPYITDDKDIDWNIINNEKNIIKNINLTKVQLLNYFIVKRAHIIYRILKKYKDKKLKCFD